MRGSKHSGAPRPPPRSRPRQPHSRSTPITSTWPAWLARLATIRARGRRIRSTAARATPACGPTPARGLGIPSAPRLRPGDRIALIAPASPLPDDGRIALALENVRALGFEPVLGDHVSTGSEYLAGSDQERAADLNDALNDASIRGIFALRGGYGTMRILDLIDYAQFARDPKCFAGFSDITTLLNVFAQRCDVVTFHAPVVSVPLAAEHIARMRSAFIDHEFPAL
ncbi:MAG TPA: LD-carboxypeptidase, partial [Candidatus Aquilonibacter sp.]